MTTITRTETARSRPQAPGGEPVRVSGIADVGQTRAFIRTSGYRRGRDDVYVPMSLVHRHGIRTGDHVRGAVHPPAGQPGAEPHQGASPQVPRQAANGKAGRQGKEREEFRVLAGVETVNDMPPRQAKNRPCFGELTPVHPRERIRLDSGSSSPTARIIDLVSPIGKGQRGLIVSPPKAGKTTVLSAIAAEIAASHPEIHLMAVLVGERPEEVTDLQRSVHGEVVFATFDQPAGEHVMVAELAIERAKRLAELGRDVVVLLDSITRLGRAYNLIAPPTSRVLAGGVATSALQPARKILGAARNLEGGGSLTILSTALVETGSRMDDVLFEEFKGTGNMELRLRRELADKRLFPAVDVTGSSTRRDELLMAPEEHDAAGRLRRTLAGLDSHQALELLLGKMRETSSNLEFLRQAWRRAG